METGAIKELDLNKLSEHELTYLRNVGLAKPVFPNHMYQAGQHPLYHKWTDKERKPFNMDKIKVWDENTSGHSFTFHLPDLKD